MRPRCSNRLQAGSYLHASAASGFTLLELLVATAIASLVLLVINATFFSALRLNNTTHDRIDQDLALQRTLSIMRRDLAGIVLPGNPQATNVLFGQLSTEASSTTTMDTSGGERVTPDIFTTSGRIDGWTPFSDVQSVAYFLSPSTDGTDTKTLVRVVTRNLLSVNQADNEVQPLLPGVVSASMSYFDGQDWQDSWDSSETSTLPSAIKFSVLVAPKGGTVSSNPAPVEIVVPVLVTTRTSQQQAQQAAATGSTGGDQ